MTYKTEVSLKIPNSEDLCCINCKINPLDMQNPIIKSLFHCQILTCRLIMYTVRCCIASPSIQNVGNLIHVIVSKQFYSTGKLQEHLLNLKVQFTDPEPVHLKIYEACLKYMFTFKLAPLWNLVGKSFYLRGFNFLSLPCSIDAVEWNILFKGALARLEIRPIKINLFPFTLECLSLSSSLVDNFLTNSNCTINYINLSLFQSTWVYVLPKLTKARVISVSKTLPESCPFENYNDLRRHWKNMYSYRIPKTDQGMLFYEVIFPMNPNQQFTYPEVCILSKIPEFLLCENKNKIASEFIKDLSTNVHSVCGEVIKIGHLFPELSVEYSCILKRKNHDYEKKNEDQSKSHFFKVSDDYIIKPTNEKMNLSSLFTFKGFDKMSASMKSHSQKVLSIMENQKSRKTTKTGTNNQYLTMIDDKWQKSSKQNYSQRSFENKSLATERKTFVDNIDDIYSYYDLPSMYSNNNNLGPISENQLNALDTEIENLGKSESKCLTTADCLESSYSNQLSNKKPIIKNVENVYFDLNNIKKIRNTSNINYHEMKQFNQSCSNQNMFDSTNVSTSISNLNSYDNLNNEKQLNNETQLTISTINSMLQNKEPIQKSKYCDTLKSQSNQSESSDEIRSLLSRFDLYNIYQQNNNDIETKIYNQNKIPDQLISFESTDKISQNLETKHFSQNFHRSIKTSQRQTYYEPENQQVDENVSRHNLNSDSYLYSSLQCSPSLLDKSKEQKNKKYTPESLLNELFSKSNKNFQSDNCDKDQQSLYQSRSVKSMIKRKSETELLKRCECNRINFNEKEINESNHLQSSPTILNSSTNLQYKREEFNNNYHLQSIQINCNNSNPSSSKIISKDELEEKSPQTIKYRCIDKNLNRRNFYKNEKIFFNDSHFLLPIEESINKKLLQSSESLVSICTSNSELEDSKQEPKIYESVESTFNKDEENLCNKIKHSSSTFNMYEKQNKILSEETSQSKQGFQEKSSNNNIECKTPSSISMLSSNRLENIYLIENESQCSPIISKQQSTNVLHDNKSNNSNLNDKEIMNSGELYLNLTFELKDNDSDSMSILSQSSNESNSGNYESYKLACTEALTFN